MVIKVAHFEVASSSRPAGCVKLFPSMTTAKYSGFRAVHRPATWRGNCYTMSSNLTSTEDTK